MGGRYAAVQNENFGLALEDLEMPGSITRTARDDFQAHRMSSPSTSPRQNTKENTTYTFVSNRDFNEFQDPEERKEPLQSSRSFTEDQSRDLLPPVDIGSSTKYQCLFAIVFGIICFLACIITCIRFWPAPRSARNRKGHRPEFPVLFLTKGLPGEAISFVANLILTQCLEGLSYVHSISLRWALLKENRLVFNTNIRLFTSSRLSRPNSWYINSISAALLVLCYGATSTLVIPEVDWEYGEYNGTYLNLVALLVLGLALLGQTLLAIWCYYNNLRDIPSWSANPLNTTVTMLSRQSVQHREGRCIVPFQGSDTSDERPMLPRTQQPNQWQVNSSARRANVFTWILVGLAYIWFLTIILVTRDNMRGIIHTIETMNPHGYHNATWHLSFDWNPSVNPGIASITTTTYFNAVFFTIISGGTSLAGALIVGLIFVCAIQGLQTLGLHCAEAIVNSSRDEDVWRALDAQRGSDDKSHVLMTPPFLAALMSWKYDMLQFFKSLLHWLLGQSIQPSYGGGNSGVWFTMIYTRLFVYAVSATVFASAIAFLTFVKPKGPQPATYGHIQTIADVIDDWTLDKDGRFWWGDKGSSEGVRHAGMSFQKEDLGPIQMDAFYAGKGSRKLDYPRSSKYNEG